MDTIEALHKTVIVVAEGGCEAVEGERLSHAEYHILPDDRVQFQVDRWAVGIDDQLGRNGNEARGSVDGV